MKLIFTISILLCLVTSQSLSQPGISAIGLEVGNKAPEIKLPDPEGDTIALSSLRGKIVLIDFWANWCAPCLKEQPELISLYQKYRQSDFINATGFAIYGVSLDSKNEEWVNTIKKFKMDWAQVSDLKFWNSGVARLYNIEEIPYNLLIDGNGIIVARNLHGKELNDELSKRLNHNQ